MTQAALRRPADRLVTWGQSHNWVPDGEAIPDVYSRRIIRPLGNSAYPGFSWQSLAPHIPTRLLPQIMAGRRHRLLLIGGSSDIGILGATGAQTLARAEAVADTWRAAITAAGATTDVIACTIPDASLFDTAEKLTQVDLHNAAMTLNANGKFTAVVDFHSAPYDNHLDTATFSDGLHLTVAAARDFVVERLEPTAGPFPT